MNVAEIKCLQQNTAQSILMKQTLKCKFDKWNAEITNERNTKLQH